MAEPVTSHEYWKERLSRAQQTNSLYRSVFICEENRWKRIEDKHRQILLNSIQDWDCILDAGCGYGRLLSLMPQTWYGGYQGVDISPDFISLAKTTYPSRMFIEGDLTKLDQLHKGQFNWAIMISVRPMIKRNLGEEYWALCERELRRVASQLLYLEYDENDNGSIE